GLLVNSLPGELHHERPAGEAPLGLTSAYEHGGVLRIVDQPHSGQAINHFISCPEGHLARGHGLPQLLRGPRGKPELPQRNFPPAFHPLLVGGGLGGSRFLPTLPGANWFLLDLGRFLLAGLALPVPRDEIAQVGDRLLPRCRISGIRQRRGWLGAAGPVLSHQKSTGTGAASSSAWTPIPRVDLIFSSIS